MAKKVNYVFLLTPNDRIRHFHEIDKGQVSRFTVQYETFRRSKWHAVVRFDTAHGFAHQDIVHPHGETEKISLGVTNFNHALTFAQNEIRNKWQSYKGQFLEEFEK